MKSKIHNLFPTCVMTFDLKEHPQTSKALEIIDSTILEEHFLLDKGASSFDDFNKNNAILDNPELFDLRMEIEKCIHQYSMITGLMKIGISNSWFNIMNEGGVVNRHRHEGSVISGAYYIRANQGSSNLFFKSPIQIHKMFDIFNPDVNTIYNAPEEEMECNEGTLILFPSWLEHGTNVNQNNDRTVISFNTIYR